jgi:hypothetical protein
MSQGPRVSSDVSSEEFLSGAYGRIRKIAIWMTLGGTITATIIWNWASGAALAVGALLAYLNMMWLHSGVEMAVERMSSADGSGPSRIRIFLAFAGRYVFLIIGAYVILRSYPQARVAFMAGLALPVIAAMFEGIYEAAVIGKTDQTS